MEIKRLLKRKKNKYSSNPRAVGGHWVREQNGEFIFGCEARLNVKNAPAEKTQHSMKSVANRAAKGLFINTLYPMF